MDDGSVEEVSDLVGVSFVKQEEFRNVGVCLKEKERVRLNEESIERVSFSYVLLNVLYII